MKVLEVNGRCPSLSQLLEDAQTEDILLVRDGRPLARLERFDEEDWQDFQYETSAEALERGGRARKQYARGEVKSLEQIKQKYARKQVREG
jgi:hypothetical protein